MMTFKNIVESLNGFLEGADSAGMADRYADEGSDILTQLSRIDGRMITGDNPAILQLLDTLDNGRRRQAHLFGQFGQRDTAVLLQSSEDLQVDGIRLEHLVACFHA